MKKSVLWFLAFVFCGLTLHAQQPKALLYLTRSTDGARSFYAHEDKIGILVPTW